MALSKLVKTSFRVREPWDCRMLVERTSVYWASSFSFCKQEKQLREREVTVVLVTRNAKNNDKKNRESNCCLDVKCPHRFTSLNTCSPAVALCGKHVEPTGSGALLQEVSHWEVSLEVYKVA